MGFEQLLVFAVILGSMSSISVLSALAEGHRPGVAIYAIPISVILAFLAYRISGDGLQMADIPDAFVVVIAGFMD